MSELTLVQPTPQTDAEYQAAIEQMLAEARRLSEQAQRDQDDIERLRAKSAPLRAEIRALLTSLGKPI
jgi:F0F1-type ATP synthase membrane subunit b/b'